MVDMFREQALVTPFVGVWIETSNKQYNDIMDMVTPFVGVWIETHDLDELRILPDVTPFVGVWIETLLKGFAFVGYSCHTLRGCVD